MRDRLGCNIDESKSAHVFSPRINQSARSKSEVQHKKINDSSTYMNTNQIADLHKLVPPLSKLHSIIVKPDFHQHFALVTTKIVLYLRVLRR